MREIEVRGHKMTVDEGVFESWATFELLAAANDEARDAFERTACLFKLVELSTGVKKPEIVEWSGGETAKITDVFELLAEIAQEASPKN